MTASRLLHRLLGISVLLMVPACYADTLDYLFTGVDQRVCDVSHDCTSQVLEFTLPSNPIPLEYTSDSFELNPNNIYILQDTFTYTSYTPDMVELYGFTLLPSAFNTPFLSGLPNGLFTGPTSSPTLLTGSSSSELYSGYSAYYDGTLVVTDLDATPTPEPSSWALLGTGLVGMAGIPKRRGR